MYKADHTCLMVSDLDAECSFYESMLGLHLVEERRPNDHVRMIFLENDATGYKLQLISGRSPAQPSFGHIAFVCDDFEASFERHKEIGCVKGSIIVQKELKSYFIVDPEGYEIEILKR